MIVKYALLLATTLMVQSIHSISLECSLPNGCTIKPIKYLVNEYTVATKKDCLKAKAMQSNAKQIKDFNSNSS